MPADSRLREERGKSERGEIRALHLLGKQGLLGAMVWRMQVLALSVLAALQPARSFLLQKPALSGVHSSRGSVAAVRGCCVQRGWSKVNFPNVDDDVNFHAREARRRNIFSLSPPLSDLLRLPTPNFLPASDSSP